MWSFEDYCARQARPLESKPSLLLEYSHSPPRTPKEPTHTPLGFLVHGTPEAHDGKSYFCLPVTSMPTESTAITTTAHNSTIVTQTSIENCSLYLLSILLSLVCGLP